MFSYPRSHPAYRVSRTVGATVGDRHRRGGRRLCWVTRVGRSVTRVGRTGRGPTREFLHRGTLWGWHRAAW